jgi:outer membrane protein
VLDQYRMGIIKLTDLLSAETSLIQAQAGYAQSLVQTKLAELDLCKSTGNLSNILNK